MAGPYLKLNNLIRIDERTICDYYISLLTFNAFQLCRRLYKVIKSFFLTLAVLTQNIASPIARASARAPVSHIRASTNKDLPAPVSPETTVMPGPQLTQAIPFAKRAKEICPGIINIWGGYFAANQFRVVCSAPYIDFVINGPGDHAFHALLDALEANKPFELISNLI